MRAEIMRARAPHPNNQRARRHAGKVNARAAKGPGSPNTKVIARTLAFHQVARHTLALTLALIL